jgi:tetratricopeptide (TPR) repeat protein
VFHPAQAHETLRTVLNRDFMENVETIASIEAQRRAAQAMTPESVWAHLSYVENFSDASSYKADLNQRAFRLYDMHCGDGVYNPSKLNELADSLWRNERFSDAAELDRMTIELAEHYLPQDHAYTLILKGNLACALDSLGRYDEAERLEVSVVNSLVRTLGEDHEDTIFYQASLSTTLRKKGNYKSALDLCLEVARKANKEFVSHHDYTLSFNLNLARAYDATCDWDKTKDILEVVAKEREKQLGFLNKKTLQACTALASTLRKLGHRKEAMVMNERVRSAVEALNYPSTPLWTLESLDDQGCLLYNQGYYFEAERVFRALTDQRTNILTSRHPDTLRSRMGLAAALYHQFKDAMAAEIGNNVLTALRDVLGNSHPSTISAMEDLAWYESRVLDIESFEAKMTEILLLRKSIIGNNHPSTLRTQIYLAEVQYRRRKPTEGQKLFAHVRESLVQLFGTKKHILVVQYFFTHANALYQNKQHDEAEILFRKAHFLMGATLGEDNPNTIAITKSLVVLLALQGRYVEAEELLSRSMFKMRCLLSPEHPLVLQFNDAQALLMGLLGRWAEAETVRRNILEKYQLYGIDHPEAIFETSRVARTCFEQGKLDETDRLHNHALGACRRQFGDCHLYSVIAVENIAELRIYQRRWIEAACLSNDALEKRADILGTQHLEILSAKCRLALLLAKKGDHKAGEVLYQQALAQRTVQLGPTHRQTLHTLSSLARIHREQGDLAQAAILYRRILETSSIVVGKMHPDSVYVRGGTYHAQMMLESFAECNAIGYDILEWTKQSFGEKSWKAALALRNLESLQSARGAIAEAELLIRRAIEAINRERKRDLQLLCPCECQCLANFSPCSSCC